jgi:hypothetical protein
LLIKCHYFSPFIILPYKGKTMEESLFFFCTMADWNQLAVKNGLVETFNAAISKI